MEQENFKCEGLSRELQEARFHALHHHTLPPDPKSCNAELPPSRISHTGVGGGK
jgi:hypothetical protein